MEEKKAMGILRAAKRRLTYELGIPEQELNYEEFSYITRIHYEAVYDDQWGENEIDYIIFLKLKDVTLNPNPEEVQELRWVSRTELDEFVEKSNALLTPWLKLILTHHLKLWWDNLQNLNNIQDHQNIYYLK